MTGTGRSRWRAAPWILLYVLIAVAPLGLATFEIRPGRGLALAVSVGLGFLALSVLGLQFVLAARSPRITDTVGVDGILRFHRHLTLLAVAMAFGHPLILFATSAHYRVLLDVVHDPLRAQLAWGSLAALALLTVTSVWRRALHLSYPAWHVLHSILGVGTVLAALGHAFLVNDYLAWMPVRALWAAYGALFVGVVVWVRLVKPMRLAGRPWRVAELWPEPGESLTVGLEPAHRHARQAFHFDAGQFAWILTGRSALTPTYHPFSMSSSAARGRVEFTIRDIGDFTSSVRGLRIGDRVFVDGPYGSFTLERHPAPGYVFLAAGVGVTPFLSMLSTLADQHDPRPLWLFLGNRHETGVVGVRQLNRIRGRLNLTLVHVISRPGGHWLGERGRMDVRILARHLPANYRELHYFVCARGDVAASMGRILYRSLGVPRSHIHAEQFRLA